jgi:hypothetical protein
VTWIERGRVPAGPDARQSGKWQHVDAVSPPEGIILTMNAVIHATECSICTPDGDRAVAGAALTLLAWTGDADDRVLAAIRSALQSNDERDWCNGWLSSVVLGTLPPGLAAPTSLSGLGGAGRFGAAVASLRFAGRSAPPGAVADIRALRWRAGC